MCELLGMSCNVPTDLRFSFTGLAKRGGETGPHGDGWGVTFYDGTGPTTFREPSAASRSELASFLCSHPIRAMVAIAHVRKRTRGRRALRNTHPFQRVLWGRTWSFAHNGTLPGIGAGPTPGFTPRGGTDSERAFCWLLGELSAAFPAGAPTEDPSRLWRAIADLSGILGAEGTFNFLLSDGTLLYARCATQLSYRIRSAPFGQATLVDADVSADFGALTSPQDRVAIVATRPLTRDEPWILGSPGTLWVFGDGCLLATLASRHPQEGERWRPAPTTPTATRRDELSAGR